MNKGNNQVRETFFVLKPIRIVPRTEDMIKRDFEFYKLKYGQDRPMEMYVRALKIWDDFHFVYENMDLSIFLDKTEAMQAALNNAADYNDGGVYNYSAVVEYYIGASYYSTLPVGINIFKHVPEKNNYEEIAGDSSNETKLILKKHYLSEE